MKKLNIPEGYQTVMPYLIVKNAKGFLNFLQQIFGAQEKQVYPAPGGNGIMHAEVTIGDSTIMFADSNEQYPPQNAGLYIHVANVDETYKKALVEGAASIIEPQKKDYGYTAGLKDPYGNTWWLVQA